MTRAGIRGVAAMVGAGLLALGGCVQTSGDSSPDGGGGSDGSVSACDTSVSVSPSSPVAPGTVVLSAELLRIGGVSGTETYSWEVSRNGMPITVTERDPDAKQVEFFADVSGPYRVVASGSVGGRFCTDTLQIINVAEPGASTRTFRLRMSPAAGQPAPVQDKVVTIPGGSDYALGVMTMDTGLALQGTLRDQAMAPLAGYLRAVPVGSGGVPHAEGFAGASGTYQLRLLPGTYDVLAVPSGNVVAPIMLSGVTASSLSTQTTLPAGQTVTGSVLDPSGAPLAGATVSMHIAGVTTTIGTTDATGAFSLRGRGAGQARVVVTPPADSGLLRLELPEATTETYAATDAVVVRYAASAAFRDVDVPVMASDGATPAPGARVVLAARPVSAAGTVTVGTRSAVTMIGRLRRGVTADATGRAVARLPEAVYDALVSAPSASPSLGSARVAVVDVSAGQANPGALMLGGSATLGGRVVVAGGIAAAGVRVTAVPRGLIASAPGATTTAVTDSSGNYSLTVVGGGAYELAVDGLGQRLARGRADVTAPAAGATGSAADITLEPAIRVTGSVSIVGVGGGAAGVHVSVLCYECTGLDASAPLAEAVTTATGSFTLLVPDPGAGP